MDFENDGYEHNEPQFRAEVDAYDRVGPGGSLSRLIVGETTLAGMQKKLGQTVSPEDRFMIYVDAISRRFNADGIATISESDINKMLEKTVYITGIKYKNPIGYILGYLASQGGTSMQHARVMTVINRVLPRIGEDGITAPDVIRYARYWMTFL
jgi:hypothetical protein